MNTVFISSWKTRHAEPDINDKLKLQKYSLQTLNLTHHVVYLTPEEVKTTTSLTPHCKDNLPLALGKVENGKITLTHLLERIEKFGAKFIALKAETIIDDTQAALTQLIDTFHLLYNNYDCFYFYPSQNAFLVLKITNDNYSIQAMMSTIREHLFNTQNNFCYQFATEHKLYIAKYRNIRVLKNEYNKVMLLTRHGSYKKESYDPQAWDLNIIKIHNNTTQVQYKTTMLNPTIVSLAQEIKEDSPFNLTQEEQMTFARFMIESLISGNNYIIDYIQTKDQTTHHPLGFIKIRHHACKNTAEPSLILSEMVDIQTAFLKTSCLQDLNKTKEYPKSIHVTDLYKV